MNGRGQEYQRYRGREHWEDDASSSSAYEGRNMSPYRGEVRGHPHHSAPSNGYSSDPGSVGSAEEGPVYVLEHLATFRVSGEAGLVYPSDGMRRLLHMEKTTGIWTQKMLLKLDKKWVFILSHENGDIVERFPMELIREPTAFTSKDPKELYNNIFIFVVAEDPKRKYDNPTEMHIFQCMRISAKDVAEDMKMYMSGKATSSGAVRGGGREQMSSPPQDSAPEPPLVSNGYRDYSDTEGRVVGEARGPRSERSSVSHNDEVSSTSSERYERDVAILNNCFDDIERFIARLQHTAAATKELERRRRSRKSKKKDIGDGLLSMRAKPPPEREFIDIFQKFKLSFNLLARLRAHIRDPNAPELVHFLFTPLALIVDASRDSFFEASLPPKVISPLLTQDAISLLTNCLSSRETELWQSLGDAWLIPREVWKYPVQPYRPVFYSGWFPEIADDTRDRRYPAYPDRPEGDLRKGLREDFEYYDSDRKEVSPPPSDIPHTRYRSPSSREDRALSMTPLSEYQHDAGDAQGFEKAQRKWLEQLKARGAKIVQVIYPRKANNDKELSVVRGEYLEITDDSRKWWRALNSEGVIAHVPHTIVTPYSPEDSTEIHRAPVPLRSAKKDQFTFHDSSDEDVSPLRRSKKTSIPAPPPPPPPESRNSTLKSTTREKVKKPMPTASQNIFGTTKSHADLMNEELKLVLDDFRKTRPHLEIVKTPDVYISHKSKPQEVQNWLKLKGFDERMQKQFDGVNGEKLFCLSRKQLENYCGKTQGARLASQITIQRNICGYKTARSSELNHILAEQRKKLETRQAAASGVQDRSSRQKKTFNNPYSSSDEGENVASNFQFLQHYEKEGTNDGYVSEEELNEDDRTLQRYPSNLTTEDNFTGTNTLKDQIKNQHKKIVKQPAEVITTR